MKVSAIQAMKRLAAENFKFKDVSFKNFEKVDVSDVEDKKEDKDPDIQSHLEVWAELILPYEGTPPESYRILNSMLMDWVDENEQELKKIINPELVAFLDGQYKDVDTSDLDQDFDDYIWEDQVDYMPIVDEDKKEITFTLELVLEIEEDEDSE